jgi:hypothetical protein
MTSDILNTWKEIAEYLKVSVSYAKELSKKHEDFPLFRDNRVFTTRDALSDWVKKKAVAVKVP